MRTLGRFRVHALDTGWQRLDGGAMFGVVPRPLWERQIPPDAKNRIRLALRCLYLDDGERRVVIDTGIGDKFDAKQNDIYGVEPAPGIRQALLAEGLDCRAVTDVILTHLHFDHAGGATMKRAQSAASTPTGEASRPTPTVDFEPTFPNATYHVQRRALAWAQHPTEKDRASFRPSDWEPLVREGRLHLINGPGELFEGMSLVLSEGHTVAQQLVLIDGGNDGKLLYCGDVIPTAAHIPLPYIMGYDLYPLTTLDEKRMILAQALEEQWLLFFEHDPKIAAARVAERNGKFVLGEIAEF